MSMCMTSPNLALEKQTILEAFVLMDQDMLFCCLKVSLHLVMGDGDADIGLSSNSSNWLRIGLYGGIHGLQLLSAIIVLAGIADQARYGPSSICILYIQDYKQDSMNPGYYLFNANSSACSGIMGLSAASMLLALIIGAASLYYIVRAEFRAVRLIFGMAVIAVVETLVAFLMAIIATIGINTTCGQFSSAGFSCGTIFSGGFFEQETSLTYPKSLGVVNLAVAASWFCFISWAAYAALEVLNWRNSV
ncbi:hypothetical protein BDR26DRAFT_1010912 [Obelidium mucronatum]|nr:hypothetical protein BDR26DRAFT_1010912 [Obelidium mucronatum]